MAEQDPQPKPCWQQRQLPKRMKAKCDTSRSSGLHKPENDNKIASAEQPQKTTQRAKRSYGQNNHTHLKNTNGANSRQSKSITTAAQSVSRSANNTQPHSPIPTSQTIPAPTPTADYYEKQIHILKLIGIHVDQAQQAKFRKSYTTTQKRERRSAARGKAVTNAVSPSCTETLGVDENVLQNWFDAQLERKVDLRAPEEDHLILMSPIASQDTQNLSGWDAPFLPERKFMVDEKKFEHKEKAEGKAESKKSEGSAAATNLKCSSLLSSTNAIQHMPTTAPALSSGQACPWSTFTVPTTPFAIATKASTQRDKKITIKKHFAVRASGPSRLLGLPRELRDIITEYVIDVSSTPEHIKEEGEAFYKAVSRIDQNNLNQCTALMYELRARFGVQHTTPGILLVNKQMHAEALRILQRRSLHFDAPAMCSYQILPLSRMVSPFVMCNLRQISFHIPIRLHTAAGMMGQIYVGSDWYGSTQLEDPEGLETLDKSEMWGHFISDCLAMLTPTNLPRQTIKITIKGRDYSTHYILPASQFILDRLRKVIKGCLESRRLPDFLAFLIHEDISGTQLACM